MAPVAKDGGDLLVAIHQQRDGVGGADDIPCPAGEGPTISRVGRQFQDLAFVVDSGRRGDVRQSLVPNKPKGIYLSDDRFLLRSPAM